MTEAPVIALDLKTAHRVLDAVDEALWRTMDLDGRAYDVSPDGETVELCPVVCTCYRHQEAAEPGDEPDQCVACLMRDAIEKATGERPTY